MKAKDILICVSGLSPAIITETYYSLAKQRSEKIIPEEVYIITTAIGKEKIIQELLTLPNNRFEKMANTYGWPTHALVEENIFVATDSQGNELSDIHSPEQFSAFADLVLRVISDKTKSKKIYGADQTNEDSPGIPEYNVHASLAGGRKTMSYYLGLAMNLFGRSNDTLSHVLLENNYENAKNFYSPGQEEKLLDRQDNEINLPTHGDNIVHMSEFPIINMRESINIDRLRNTTLSFDEILKVIKAEQEGIVTPIKWEKKGRTYTVQFGLEQQSLEQQEMSILLWLGWRAKQPERRIVDLRKDNENPGAFTEELMINYLERALFRDYLEKPEITFSSVKQFITEHEDMDLNLNLQDVKQALKTMEPKLSTLKKKLANVSSAYLKTEDAEDVQKKPGCHQINHNTISEETYSQIDSWIQSRWKIAEQVIQEYKTK